MLVAALTSMISYLHFDFLGPNRSLCDSQSFIICVLIMTKITEPSRDCKKNQFPFTSKLLTVLLRILYLRWMRIYNPKTSKRLNP